MCKHKAIVIAVCAAALFGWICAGAAWESAEPPQQSGGLPPGPLQEKARAACLGCHNAAIIVQQQLDRRIWTREVDKMIRWGAPVAAADRDALIDYFAEHFGPRSEQSALKLPDGPGVETVRATCLACHDAGNIIEQQLDRRGWSRKMDKMIGWGADVPDEDREVILNYLVAHFSPATKGDKKEDKPK